MAFLSKYFRLAFIGLFTCALSQVVSAQNIPENVRLQALDLAKKIEEEHLVLDKNWAVNEINSETLAPQKHLRLLRNMITEAVAEGDTDLSSQLKEYRRLALGTGIQRDQDIADFFEDILRENESRAPDFFQQAIYKYQTHADWFVRHRAYYFKGLFSPQASSPSVALQYAQDTFALIPQENSVSEEADYILEAKILSITEQAYLHNLLGNPELSIPTTIDVIRLKKSVDEPINGGSIINNLIFSFSMWRDHTTVKALIETLLRLEKKTGNDVPGLTELRASSVYIETGDFKNSLSFAEQSLELAELDSIKKGAELNRIIALAGLGNVSAAEKAYEFFEQTTPVENRTTGTAEQKIHHIRALLALAKKDDEAVQKHMNARMNSTIQHILTRNNSETASVLASLHNSKERRSEREASLEREAELKQIALNRQKRVIGLLFALAGILALLTTGTAAFARFRSRAAKEMSIAADMARAGEKAKSEFLAVMSHELRTPLNGILGMADVLSRTAPDDAYKKKNDIILKSGHDLLALVENIFDMTLIESGDLTTYPMPVNIHDLITRKTEEWRDVIEDKNIIYTVHIDPSVPERLELDRDRFAQCMNNLLSNAAKFTVAGRIHVHIMGDQASLAHQAQLKVIVADTGVGISEDAKDRLFKPFVQADSSMTREYGGAGLGLVIVKSLAQMMGGDLTVNSRENRGSEFTLTLRADVCEPENALPVPQTSVQARPVVTTDVKIGAVPFGHIARHGERFLIVDDDITCQNVVQTLLEPTGAHMTCVSSGQEALSALSLDTYDVVIMDIRMPGMDGVTAIRRIRQSRQDHSDIPIIALTADVTAETNARCMVAGVDIFLTKPVRADDFYNAIEFVKQKTQQSERGAA